MKSPEAKALDFVFFVSGFKGLDNHLKVSGIRKNK